MPKLCIQKFNIENPFLLYNFDFDAFLTQTSLTIN